MTPVDQNEEGLLSIPAATVEVEALDVMKIVIIRNPPPDLVRRGVRDAFVWRQFGHERGYEFFDSILRGDSALPVGEPRTWIFADGDREIEIRGMLTADDVEPASGIPAGDDMEQKAVPSLADLVSSSYLDAPAVPRPEAPRAAEKSSAEDFSIATETSPPPRPHITPIEPMPAVEETPHERARRKWDEFQVFRLNNLGEPGNALGPGAASAIDPF